MFSEFIRMRYVLLFFLSVTVPLAGCDDTTEESHDSQLDAAHVKSREAPVSSESELSSSTAIGDELDIESARVADVSAQGQRYGEHQEKQTSKDTTPNGLINKVARQGQGWPKWRGPQGNNHSDEKGLIKRFPDGGPKIVWRQELGSGFSGLSIAEDHLYTLFGRGGREYVACFNADTGAEKWKIDLDEDFSQGRSFGPRATPCVDGNRVYAAGASGEFCCLNTQDGKEIWSFNLYEKFGMPTHEEGLSCSPLIDGQKVLMATGNSAFAFDKSNGKLIWRSLQEKMNHSTPAIAKLDGKQQMIVLTAGNLVGLNPEDGKEHWRFPQRGVNCVTPVVGPGNQVFTGAAYGFGCQLVKVANDSPSQVYKNSALSTHHATAMLYQRHLYGFHDRPGIFKCVEFATGDEKWVSRSPGKGKLIIADEQLIIVSEHGELILAKPTPEGYHQTAKAKVVSGTCFTAPSLVKGKLYVRSDNEMVCIDLKK